MLTKPLQDLLNLEIVGKQAPGPQQQAERAAAPTAGRGDVLSETGMSETDELRAEFMEREAQEENL